MFRNSKKSLMRAAAAAASAALCAGLLTGCNLMPAEEDVMPPPIQEPAEVKLNTVTVEKGDIQNAIYCVGTFVSTEQAELKFQVSAKLKAVYVSTGDIVTEGQLLAELENTGYESSLKTTESDIAKAQLSYKQQLDSLQNNIDSAKLKLDSLKDELTELKKGKEEEEDLQLEKLQQAITDAETGYSDLQKAEQELKDKVVEYEAEIKESNATIKNISSSLKTENVTSAQAQQLIAKSKELKTLVETDEAAIKSTNETLKDYYKKYDAQQRVIDDAKKAVEVYNKEQAVAEKDADSAKVKQIENKQKEIESQQKAIESAQLAYDTYVATEAINDESRADSAASVEEELQKTYMYSPINGKVSFVGNTAIGDPVDPTQVFIKLANLDKLILQYNSDVEKAKKFEQNMEVTVVYGKDEYPGVVTQSPNDADENADEVTKKSARIQVSGLPDTVKLGEAASITLVLEEAKDVIVISKDLLKGSEGGYYVMVNEDGIRTERSVEVGIISDTEVEIRSGLEVGEQVIRN